MWKAQFAFGREMTILCSCPPEMRDAKHRKTGLVVTHGSEIHVLWCWNFFWIVCKYEDDEVYQFILVCLMFLFFALDGGHLLQCGAHGRSEAGTKANTGIVHFST